MLDGNGGFSHGGWFSQGFGAIPAETKPALLWTYNHFAAETDEHRRDTLNYPHRAIFALVNWPIGMAERNPAEILGRTSVDRVHGWYLFRNRWQDADDVVVSLWLGSGPQGNIGAGGPDLLVWGMGERVRLATLPRCQTTYYRAEKDGSGVVSGGGYSVAVDFSGRSGAPVLVAIASESDLGKSSPPRRRRRGSDHGPEGRQDELPRADDDPRQSPRAQNQRRCGPDRQAKAVVRWQEPQIAVRAV